MIRRAGPWLVTAGILACARVAGAEPAAPATPSPFAQWHSSTGPHGAPPGGRAKDKKDKDKKDEDKKDEDKKDKGKKDGPTQSAPDARAPKSLAEALSWLGLPMGLALTPTAAALAATAPAGSAPGAPHAEPGQTPAGAQAGPTAPGMPAPPVAPGAASPGAGPAPSGTAAAGAAGAAGTAPAAGGAAIAGTAPAGAAAAGASVAALAELHVRAEGAVAMGPGDAVVLAPRAAAMIATPHRADLTSEAEIAELTATGDQLLAQGNTTAACPLLERALVAKRTPAVLLSVARCYEAQGRTASAWLGFTAVASAAHEPSVRDEAKVASSRLARTLARLKVLVVGATGAAPPVVKLDGRTVPAAHWGHALPIDPGAHVVTVQAPGQPTWERRVTSAPGAPLVVTWSAPQAAPPEAEPRSWIWSPPVLVAGGATILTGAAAVVTGVWMLSVRADFDARNGRAGETTQSLDALHDRARTLGVASTVLAGAFGVGLGVTTLFALKASADAKPGRANVVVSPTVGSALGVSIGGTL